MQDLSSDHLSFAGLTLDFGRGRLSRAGADVPLRARSFALLVYLARNAGRVLSKDELIGQLWPDVIVTEDSLTQCISDVRQALGPDGAAMLRTLPRRGYLFAPDAAPPAAAAAPLPVAEQVALRPDGIAVLPFDLAPTVPPGDAHLYDGIAHDIITRLARLRAFHVIARGSTFALRHLSADPAAAGRALGVAHVVVGTVRARGAALVLRLDIVDAETGSIQWTDDFHLDRANLLPVIDPLTDRIVQSVQLEVTAAETRRALALRLPLQTAWGAFHAGLADTFHFHPQRAAAALDRFAEATDLAPDFARAHAAASLCHYFFAFSGFAPDRAAAVARARASAEAAMRADPQTPAAPWALGRALWLEGDSAGCLSWCRAALALSPGFVHGHYMEGFVEAHEGDPQRGIEAMDRMIALSPYDPFMASAQITRAFGLMRLDKPGEAADWAAAAARQPNTYPSLLFPAALILAAAGRTGEARRIAAAGIAQAPGYRLDMVHVLDRTDPRVARLLRRLAPGFGLA